MRLKGQHSRREEARAEKVSFCEWKIPNSSQKKILFPQMIKISIAETMER